VVLLESGNPQEALKWLQRARTLGSDRPDLSYNLVRAELEGNHPEAAVEEVESSAARFGDDSRWRVAIGELFLRSHQPKEAIKQLLAASGQEHKDPTIQHLLAEAYLQAGQPDAVAGLLMPPASAEDSFLLASAALMRGDLEDASRLSADSLREAQNDPRYYLLSAQIDQRRNRQQEALKTLAQAIQLRPDLPEAYYYQAVSYFFLAEYDQVRRSLDQAQKHSSPAARALFLYAMSYENESRWDKETIYLHRALQLEHSNARFECHLGFALMSENQIEPAKQAFATAIRVKPDFALPHFELGKLLAQENNLRGAQDELENAVRLQPDLGPALYALSRVYKAQGRKAQADETMKQFVALRAHEAAEKESLAADAREQLQQP
jgi:tetratricopeptide (TPR) repeat protein